MGAITIVPTADNPIPTLPWPKDPDEDLVITFDLSVYLAGLTGSPTISSGTFTATGATVVSQSYTTTSGTVRISGGAAGATAELKLAFTRSDGVPKVRRCYVTIAAR